MLLWGGPVGWRRDWKGESGELDYCESRRKGVGLHDVLTPPSSEFFLASGSKCWNCWPNCTPSPSQPAIPTRLQILQRSYPPPWSTWQSFLPTSPEHAPCFTPPIRRPPPPSLLSAKGEPLTGTLRSLGAARARDSLRCTLKVRKAMPQSPSKA